MEWSERVVLGSTITLNSAVGGWRLDTWLQSNGDWGSGVTSGFGLCGVTTSGSHIRIVTGGGIVFNDGSIGRSIAPSLATDTLLFLSMRCDTTDIEVYDEDNNLLGSTPVSGFASISLQCIGSASTFEAMGMISEMKINDTSNSDSFTHHYSGKNGNWTDLIGSIDGTAGPDLTYVKNTNWANNIL